MKKTSHTDISIVQLTNTHLHAEAQLTVYHSTRICFPTFSHAFHIMAIEFYGAILTDNVVVQRFMRFGILASDARLLAV